METKKMSLANIKGKLSRVEMKNIMAGSGDCGMGWQWIWGCTTEGEHCPDGAGWCHYCASEYQWICDHG